MSDSHNEPLDLRDLLDKTSNDFPDLPDFPAEKSFFGRILSIYADRSSQKHTPFFGIKIRLTDPGDDVPKEWMENLRASGFTLADYEPICRFYLTPAAMKMFRRFADSIGKPPQAKFFEWLKLNPETLEPTDETQELLRGTEVFCRTKPVGDNGRVYSGELNSVAGVKR